MQMRTRSGLVVVSVGLLMVFSASRLLAADAASATGTWKWSRARNDGTSMDFVLNLKQDGEKLSGGMKVGEGQETAIEEGKISGKDISFTVTRERNGNKFVSKYTGQLDGDTIKGKITGNFGGQDRTFDWEAKRAKD